MTQLRIALALLLSPLGIADAADWHLSPVISIDGEYNDNPWLRYQGVEAVRGGFADLSLPLVAKTERMQFQAVADGRAFHYDDPLFSHNDVKLDMSLKDTGERSTFAGTANWTYDTTLTSELGTTGLTDVNKRHTHYDASLSPQIQLSEGNFAILDLRGQSNHYEDAALTGLVDYRYASALAGYQRQWSPITAVGIGLQGGTLSVPDRTDLESTDGLLRFALSHNFTERLSLDAFAGPAVARQHGLKSTWSAAGQLTIKYGGLLTDFSLQMGRQFAPTGYGALTVQESVAISMSHRLTEKLSSVTTASYLDSNYRFGTTSAAHYDVHDWRVDQGFSWQWTETVAISLAASETLQSVSTVTNHARRFTANLGINWTPPRIF